MRILHLADRLSQAGGAWLHLQAILARQAGRHELHLAAGSLDRGVTAPCPVDRLSILGRRRRRTAGLDQLDRLVESFRPDLIHVQNLVNPAVLEWAAAHSSVATIQDHRFFCPGMGKWTLKGDACTEVMDQVTCAGCFEDPVYFEHILGLTRARLQALKNLQHLVVLSRYMRDELVAAGVEPERIHVIPPFVHGLDPPADAPGEPCVLLAGRLVPAKGVDEAVQAWTLAATGLPLVVAGDGPLRESAEAAGAQVLGWQGRTAMAALLHRSAALLMPSRWQEPFGMVGQEAQAQGVPVVAWDSGGIAEWHRGGSLVAWGDVNGLARELRRAVSREAPVGDSRLDLEAAAHARMEDLDGVYRQVLMEAKTATAQSGTRNMEQERSGLRPGRSPVPGVLGGDRGTDGS